MVKPVGPACNYDCDYCFYTAKRALYPKPARLRLPEPVLEAFLRGILDGRAASVQLCWQGGEPTLAGLDFLRRAVELAERLRPEGMQLEHSLQTNGSLIDETWAEFLGQTGILVGLSIDGPKALTDHYRRDRKGRPTYERTRRALDLLLQRGVAVNTLTVVHRKNVREGRRIYRFLRQAGVDVMQFIPLVERLQPDGCLALPGTVVGEVAPWSVPPEGFGRFLGAVFDEWLGHDVGRVYVMAFESLVGHFLGAPAGQCVHAARCGRSLALEHNGDLYACDHYVDAEHRLGNVAAQDFTALAASPQQCRFGAAKETELAELCRACPHLALCGGDCPKHCFVAQNGGNVSYLCPSYRRFFAHAAPRAKALARSLTQAH
jgi:uncharacterized protein